VSVGVATAVVVDVGELGAVDSGLSKRGSDNRRPGLGEEVISDWRTVLAGEDITEKEPVA
jgi:hypothetical protein